jgi:hypothetical protein
MVDEILPGHVARRIAADQFHNEFHNVPPIYLSMAAPAFGACNLIMKS